MHFRLSEETEAFRAEVRAFLAEHVTPEVRERVHRTGTVHDWGFYRALAARGWIAPHWPVEDGGQGRNPWEIRVFQEECALADAPTNGLAMTLMVANTLRAIGTDEQKREVLPRILRGEIVICLGYSEPQAGSDVAAAELEARRDGDTWILNGKKTFTSLAHEAQYVFLLTRTNREAAKHRGLTMFLVPMDSPGIRIEPVETLGAPGRTNRTFYHDVRVGDDARVGEVDGGWEVLTLALAFERVGLLGPVRALAKAVEWARVARRPDGSRVIDDPGVRERLAGIALENEVAQLLSWRTTWKVTQEQPFDVDAAMAKLFAAELTERASSDLLDLVAPASLLHESEAEAPGDGELESAYRKAPVTRLYGGSSEIMRGIIAERGLGLPRTRGRPRREGRPSGDRGS